MPYVPFSIRRLNLTLTYTRCNLNDILYCTVEIKILYFVSMLPVANKSSETVARTAYCLYHDHLHIKMRFFLFLYQTCFLNYTLYMYTLYIWHVIATLNVIKCPWKKSSEITNFFPTMTGNVQTIPNPRLFS